MRRGTKIREGTNKQNKRTRSDAREDRDEKREEKEGILGWKRVWRKKSDCCATKFKYGTRCIFLRAFVEDTRVKGWEGTYATPFVLKSNDEQMERDLNISNSQLLKIYNEG